MEDITSNYGFLTWLINTFTVDIDEYYSRCCKVNDVFKNLCAHKYVYCWLIRLTGTFKNDGDLGAPSIPKLLRKNFISTFVGGWVFRVSTWQLGTKLKKLSFREEALATRWTSFSQSPEPKGGRGRRGGWCLGVKEIGRFMLPYYAENFHFCNAVNTAKTGSPFFCVHVRQIASDDQHHWCPRENIDCKLRLQSSLCSVIDFRTLNFHFTPDILLDVHHVFFNNIVTSSLSLKSPLRLPYYHSFPANCSP